MNGIVDRNNLTVQAMNNGSMIDLSKGQRDIAMYENIVDIYEEAVPNIRAASNVINRSANATEIGEKLSLTGPPAYQLDIIRKMNTDEAADLQIIQEGNNIIIRDPNATYIDPETGKEVKGTELNINQFNKAITDKENPYFKYAVDTKPDTERNFNQKIKSGKDGAFNPLYVTIDDKAKDATGQEVTTYNMTIAQQEKFKKDVMGDKGNGYANGGQFAGLIDQFGESIWEDQMQGGENNTQYPEEVPKMPIGPPPTDEKALKEYNEQLEEYGAYYNDYYKPMLDALANQSLNNAASNGIVLDKPKEEPADEETEEVTEEVAEEVTETPEATEEEEKDDFVSNTSSTIFDYESKSGSAGGGGLKDFGFTNKKYKDKKYDKYRDDNGDLTKEGAQIIFEEEYMSQVPSEYPNQIKQQLADYKFNSSMSTLDLMLLANGDITLREARDEAEHGDLWKEKKEEIEKLMQEDPVAFNEKIKQAKRDIYKDLDPKKYENTWKTVSYTHLTLPTTPYV